MSTLDRLFMESPTARTRTERSLLSNFDSRTRQYATEWVVDNCPFCGDRHRHGPGEGLRASHCGQGYYVLLKPTGRSKTRLPFRQVWDRDGWRCVFCGVSRDLTVDHIVPVSKGGTDDLGNLQTACGSCNSSKGNGEAPKKKGKRTKE